MADPISIPSVTGVDNAGSVPEPTSRSSAPKRRRFENVSTTFLEAHHARTKLNAYSQEVGGDMALDEAVERPRFLLLVKACREGDVFFVALHQLFCSWTVSQISVHKLCDENMHDASLVDNAFGIMGTILKANSKFREPLLGFFANFPTPLSTLQLDRFYRQTINQVLDFLIHVSRRWSIVNHEHILKGYPLLMSELVNIFRLHSPTLQTIVFRASRRTLGVPDHPIGTLMDELFKADQEKHWSAKDGSYSLRLEGAAYEKYNNDLMQHYQLLVNRTKRTTIIPSSQSPSMPSASTAHSSAASSPSMAGEHFHFDTAQGARSLPPAVSTTGRVSTNGQNIHSPSPTYSPIAQQQSILSPNMTTAFTPQMYGLPNHSGAPYQPTGLSQQGQPGASNINIQQIPQHHHAELLRQRQHLLHQQHLLMQQQQQQQLGRQVQQQQQQQTLTPLQYQQVHQFHNTLRNRSQPGATTSPRPSPIQSTHILPGQGYSVRQIPTQSPNIYNQPASPASFAHPPFTPSLLSSLQQQSHVNPLSSPQAMIGTQPNSDYPHSNVAPQQQPSYAIDRLLPSHPDQRIPLNEYPHTPYDKRSIDTSLHQAHLRSPKRVLRTPSTGPPERYYQAIKSFALEPKPVPPEWTKRIFNFNITEETYGKLTFNEDVPGEWLLVNRFSGGSLRIRARCCNLSMPPYPVPDHTWVTSETAWPEHIWMTLNDQCLEVMRKQHHSKDLPTELSSFIHPGVNTLTVSIPKSSTQSKQQTPYIAVEIVEVLSHSAILEIVHGSRTRPAAETWQVIQSRLASNPSGLDGDDNDLEMSNDGISIDLADPFTAKIFNVPVRGKACKHLECFDLENWLNTRLGKKSTCTCGGVPSCICPKEPSFVDKWRCPFCDGDARPYSLYIDGFLAEVRTSLEQAHQLRTKSITVYANRSWKANDPAGDDDSDTESDDDTTRSTSKAASKSTVIDIIEIDDD
ncbi:hypothetical protein NPX13_g9175 [Xylaria arbuscula]|uniref:SP-RING-type domain-containing protein n=1 Tax=Xylaria arbuscula TaxID=114810 RepID=A0A9W8N780_9PEZI|nr:hypothetical protein NPX13_g9175 [Xylaria arbuscula]